MAGVVFDTNIWIAYKPTKLPKNLVMSAVVLQELVAGASDGAVLKRLEASRNQYE
jgi:predicted nucleic acid-binding protein